MNSEIILSKIQEVAFNYNLDVEKFSLECNAIYRNLSGTLDRLRDLNSIILEDLIKEECEIFYNL